MVKKRFSSVSPAEDAGGAEIGTPRTDTVRHSPPVPALTNRASARRPTDQRVAPIARAPVAVIRIGPAARSMASAA